MRTDLPPHPKVVVTLPAYCAEKTLRKTVEAIPASSFDHIILVDDASPDGTVRVARELGVEVIVHRDNRGYGGNQKTCYREALRAGADIVVLLHPDYQYDPRAVPLLVAPILGGYADMTFGSRFAGLGDPTAGGMPLYRYVGNRVTTVVENLVMGSRFTETHSGLRAYTRDCLLALPFLRYSDDYVFDSELLAEAITAGQRVVEVPIGTRYTEESSSISIPRSLRYVAGSVGTCARKTATRGRRRARRRRGEGRVAPVAAHGNGERACVLCGGTGQRLLYPANVQGLAEVDEFACTTGGLAQHDDIVECEGCGLVSSVPSMKPGEIVSSYGQVVDEDYLSEEPTRREVFAWLADALAGYVVPGNRLLEVGANVGLFLDVAGQHGWKATGVEPSAWAVSEGVKRFGVDLRQALVEDLDEPPGSADVVVMFDVLEHLTQPLEALRRIRPLVQEEGLLALSTVNVESLHARARRGSWPWFIRSHLFYFSPPTLSAMLSAAGFRLVEWRTVPRSFRLSYLSRRMASAWPVASRAAAAVSNVTDLRLPLGWLGDIVLAVARPR